MSGCASHAEKEIWLLLIFNIVRFGGTGNSVKAGALSGDLHNSSLKIEVQNQAVIGAYRMQADCVICPPFTLYCMNNVLQIVT